jgi:rhodanese-related sulfurtransferase
MSNVLLVLPEDAHRWLECGYTYVDVRSELEFRVAHVPGALNVPLQCVEGDRLVDNPEFSSVMSALFRTTDPLMIGCRSGTRSHVAVQRLLKDGFVDLVELARGFSGARDAFGRRLPGWEQCGLPVERGEPEARGYAALRARAEAARVARTVP